LLAMSDSTRAFATNLPMVLSIKPRHSWVLENAPPARRWDASDRTPTRRFPDSLGHAGGWTQSAYGRTEVAAATATAHLN
jgi:hypothetical protein